MHFVKWSILASMVASGGLLAACGGGGGSNPPPPPAAPSALSYPAHPAFTVGTGITALSPTVTGTVTTYTVAPALPAGLALSATTGVISGTPTAAAANANYVVTAGNAAGSTTATVAISVNEAVPTISYAAPAAFTKGTAITALTPTVSGNVTGYSINPALPTGLTLSATTGVITGTPLAVSATATYTVTATNATGQGTATLSITVVAVTYPSSVYSFPKGVAIGEVHPRVDGALATAWSVSPALPAGVSLLGDSGILTGTPTALSARATYHVTASIAGGGDSVVDLELGVTDAVLVDLGHQWSVVALRANGQRMLSADERGHVVLWNQQTGANLFSETLPCNDFCDGQSALAGTTAVVRSDRDFEVLSATSGALLSRPGFDATAGSWWRLAADGSYLVGGNSAGFTVWSPSGAVLLTRPGNYGDALPFAMAGELRIARGAAGAGVLEKVTVPGGAVTTSNIQGTFHAWFDDGERFLTKTGNTAWVYSKDGVQQDLVALPAVTDLAGTGNWFWIREGAQLRIYAVGSSATPTVSYAVDPSSLPRLVVSGGALAVIPYGTASLSVIDLSGGAPAKADYSSPVAYLSTFAAASAADWAVGNRRGVVLGELGGGTPQRYAYGAALSIAGSTQRVVVATASGSILSYDASTLVLEAGIPFRSSKVQLSADGAVLGVSASTDDSQYSTDRTLKFYSMPAASVSFTRTYANPTAPNSQDQLLDWTMSRSATTVGEVLWRDPYSANFDRVVTQLDGTPIHSNTATRFSIDYPSLTLSPNGSLSATTTPAREVTTATNLYSGATLTGASAGLGIGWADNSRLLVNRYTTLPNLTIVYAGVDIVNGTGVLQTHIALPEIFEFQPVSPTRIYAPATNAVYDLMDGSGVWSSGSNFPPVRAGAVAGANVFFASDAAVRIAPL